MGLCRAAMEPMLRRDTPSSAHDTLAEAATLDWNPQMGNGASAGRNREGY